MPTKWGGMKAKKHGLRADHTKPNQTKWPRKSSDCESQVMKEEEATVYVIQDMSIAKKLLGCEVKGDSYQNSKQNNRRPPQPVLHW